MKKLLYINSCVNRKTSRTLKISSKLINTLKDKYDVTELILENENFLPFNTERLNARNKLLAKKDLSNPYFNNAIKFANADLIVIAAPYWDFTFPSLLKIYIENISVPGITYKYDENGCSKGLCKAKKLYYVTSRGGFTPDAKDLGYKTIKNIAKLFGIKNVKCFSIQGVDIPTTDVDSEINNIILNFKI